MSEYPDDVYKLLRLYAGPQAEAYKPHLHPYRAALDQLHIEEVEAVSKASDKAAFDKVRAEHSARRAKLGADCLELRSQVPDELEKAFAIALGEGLLEQFLLKPEDQLRLYELRGMPTPPQGEKWTVYPSNADALVSVTDKGRGALAIFDIRADQPNGRRGKRGDKAATVNERMAAMLQADPALLGLAASAWAEKLGCTAAAVKQTDTWKTIRNARTIQRVDRAALDRGKSR